MLSFLEHQIEYKKFRKNFKANVPCMMSIYENCSSKPINSHTISKTSLKLLAEDGLVITPVMYPTAAQGSHTQRFLSKGIRIASSFPGFCSHHDAKVFESIDSANLNVNEGNIKLLFLRCLSHELFKKYQIVKYQEHLLSKELVKTSPNFNAHINGTKLGARILLEQLLEIKSSTTNISYFSFKFGEILPFAFMGVYGFELEKIELENGPVYDISDADHKDLGNTLLTVIPTTTGSHFIIASINKKGIEFNLALERFKQGTGSIVEFIFQFGVDKMENLFFQPSWFLSQPKNIQEKIEHRYHITIGNYERDFERPFSKLFHNYPQKHGRFTNSLKAKIWHKKYFTR